MSTTEDDNRQFAPAHGSAAWVQHQMSLAELKLQSRARRLGAHWYGVKDCETYEKRMNDLKRAAIEYAYAVEAGVLPPPNASSSATGRE